MVSVVSLEAVLLWDLTADRRIKLTSCLRAGSDVCWVFEVFLRLWNFSTKPELHLVVNVFFRRETKQYVQCLHV